MPILTSLHAALDPVTAFRQLLAQAHECPDDARCGHRLIQAGDPARHQLIPALRAAAITWRLQALERHAHPGELQAQPGSRPTRRRRSARRQGWRAWLADLQRRQRGRGRGFGAVVRFRRTEEVA